MTICTRCGARLTRKSLALPLCRACSWKIKLLVRVGWGALAKMERGPR